MLSKLNKYQQTVIFWGIICFVGFFLSQILPFFSESKPLLGDLRVSLYGWLVLTIIALYFQVVWMWYDNVASIGSQVSWIVVAIGGWVLTYFKLYGYILVEIKATTMWLILCAIAMLFTAFFNKNNVSYYLLTIAYVAAGALIEFTSLPFEMVIVGVLFLVIGILDAALEYSSWRKGLAEV
jgi:hypothetical protein